MRESNELLPLTGSSSNDDFFYPENRVDRYLDFQEIVKHVLAE